jgi:hypothetical protein
MNWLTNLFKRKKQDTVKKTENNRPKPLGEVYYSDYTPTGRTEEIRYVDSTTNQNKGDFFLSLLAAEATDSAAMGMAIGGDPAGAIIGEMLNDNHSSNDANDYSAPSSNNDYGSSSNDYGSSSNDSWSSSSDYGSSSSDSSSFGSDSSSSSFDSSSSW